MTTPDFRALCAELYHVWIRATNPDDLYENLRPLIARARAALAAEPVGEPGEVAELVAWLHGQDGGREKLAIHSRIATLLQQRSAPTPFRCPCCSWPWEVEA
jgi:hypothetical protein